MNTQSVSVHAKPRTHTRTDAMTSPSQPLDPHEADLVYEQRNLLRRGSGVWKGIGCPRDPAVTVVRASAMFCLEAMMGQFQIPLRAMGPVAQVNRGMKGTQEASQHS